jgi:hypothetical protein
MQTRRLLVFGTLRHVARLPPIPRTAAINPATTVPGVAVTAPAAAPAIPDARARARHLIRWDQALTFVANRFRRRSE